jgi:hypothetical protein
MTCSEREWSVARCLFYMCSKGSAKGEFTRLNKHTDHGVPI